MNATRPEVEKYLELLEATPRRIKRATGSMDDARLRRKTDLEPWSVNDILAHLRSCADVWGDSIDAMLAEENPTVPYRHPRQWIKKTNYLQLPFQESFHVFVTQRKKLLKVLESLAFEDWSRAALIQSREHTVFTQARRLANHENGHCIQIENLLQ